MAKPLKIKKVSPSDWIDKSAVRILRARLKEFYLHWPDPDLTTTPQQIHDMRISGKRLRYSAESLREFYPDQLALLIDLLKRSQDLLGEIQDCLTQRTMIDEDLQRLKKRDDDSKDIAVLERIIAKYDQRQSLLFTQFREVWRGMTMDEFRTCLTKMISRTNSRQTKSDDALIHLINPS